MEYFNFSHLPLLVKEMIADEIVHNSIPEDRIQFATTCKAFNQLVKHAKPKKIIRELRIHCHKFFESHDIDVLVCINSGHKKTLSELKKILEQCQVENLSIEARSTFHDMHFCFDLMNLLMEPCRFVTVLSITSWDPEFKYVDFYEKLRHLKSFEVYDKSGVIENLPYFPPKLVLRNEYSLLLLAEKTLNHPFSFLKITSEVHLTEIQQFLTTANLRIGAEIRLRFEDELKSFLTFIGNGLFEFQMLRAFEYFILDQQNEKILKLLTDFYLGEGKKEPFTVTSLSSPDTVVFSGEITGKSREIIFENVADNHFVKISFSHPHYSTYYSPQLLDNWFPRTENYDPFERVKTINKTLGTNISIIKPEMLEEKFMLNDNNY